MGLLRFFPLGFDLFGKGPRFDREKELLDLSRLSFPVILYVIFIKFGDLLLVHRHPDVHLDGLGPARQNLIAHPLPVLFQGGPLDFQEPPEGLDVEPVPRHDQFDGRFQILVPDFELQVLRPLKHQHALDQYIERAQLDIADLPLKLLAFVFSTEIFYFFEDEILKGAEGDDFLVNLGDDSLDGDGRRRRRGG